MLAYIPITVLATWVCHPLLLTLLSHRGFGFDSVPIATAITVWLLALLTLAYICVLKPHDPRTWTGVELGHALSRHGMAQFLRIALPGVFTMTEWWYVGLRHAHPRHPFPCAHKYARARAHARLMAGIGSSSARPSARSARLSSRRI